jgi:alpha/beta hydrolase family protein
LPQVTSRDGTPIAYHRQGAGPPVILVGGGLDDGSENAPLATELAARFTVYNYARRGRGESGDTQPYAVERELEDLEALIGQAGGSAHVHGVSSGGMFAFEAAAAGLALQRLAVYEVPYDAACYGPPPVDRLATVTQPTLVLTGGGVEFFELAADAVAAAIPSAERAVLEGQGHVADPKSVATALERFLNGRSSGTGR